MAVNRVRIPEGTQICVLNPHQHIETRATGKETLAKTIVRLLRENDLWFPTHKVLSALRRHEIKFGIIIVTIPLNT